MTSYIGAGLISAAVSHSVPPTKCGVFENLQFCYYEGAPSSNKVIYFFHGYGNDETAWSWNSVTKDIQEVWKKENIERPTVISMSFAPMWWYKNLKTAELLDRFSRVIETELFPSKDLDRRLYGDSMGGHNALGWASDTQLNFDKMALICPAIPNPNYAERVYAQASEGWIGLAYFARKLILGDGTVVDPLSRVLDRFNRGENFPSTFLSLTPRDHFGFYPGNKMLFEIFEQLNSMPVQVDEQSVIHCNVEATRLAHFLGE